MTHRNQRSATPPSVVQAAIEQLQQGNFVVVADDTDRENEGDLVGLAEHMTPESMAFLVRRTSGVVCVAMSGERLDELRIPLMVSNNTDNQTTAFTVSVDYIPGTTTGISARDRSATVRALGSVETQAQDFSRPGHVFPLRARPLGVLERRGHTEAAVDLARLAAATPAAAIAELMHDDGTMMRGTELREFARTHGLTYLTIDDLVRYRKIQETLIEHTASSRLPTRHGDFVAHVYRSQLDGLEHVALVFGKVDTGATVLTRLHSECLTGDALCSLRCDCGLQLDLALRQIVLAGAGVLVYIRGHEGRGIGLTDKIRAYALQDIGRDTVDANLELGLPIDARQYDTAAQILRHLMVERVNLLSNNPAKLESLEAAGVRVCERVPLVTPPTSENSRYLSTKAVRLGHLLSRPLLPGAAAAAFDQQRVSVKATLEERQHS
jgi:3,4-dihydroxy 2-butanone 4-phosphate synthase/GTP cyclohydrolase II